MANPNHVAKLKEGVEAWNEWRAQNPNIWLDLTEAHLRGIDLSGANLRGVFLDKTELEQANLTQADLDEASLNWADLIGADCTEASLIRAHLVGAYLPAANFHRATLSAADLSQTSLRGANFHEATLSAANLRRADLSIANFHKAILPNANLERASLIETDLTEADLSGARVYGISAWNPNLTDAIQTNLIITPRGEPEITVDNLEIAQFIYLLLNNEKIRSVIDTLTTKSVLILGRFTDERKAVLDAIRDELRRRDYVPILFDFEPSVNRNLTETVRTLAHLVRFIIADITDAKSIPQELQAIVPNLPSVPVKPIILASQHEYALFDDFLDEKTVLPVYRYKNQNQLIASLADKVIAPAEEKAEKLQERRRKKASRTTKP